MGASHPEPPAIDRFRNLILQNPQILHQFAVNNPGAFDNIFINNPREWESFFQQRPILVTQLMKELGVAQQQTPSDVKTLLETQEIKEEVKAMESTIPMAPPLESTTEITTVAMINPQTHQVTGVFYPRDGAIGKLDIPLPQFEAEGIPQAPLWTDDQSQALADAPTVSSEIVKTVLEADRNDPQKKADANLQVIWIPETKTSVSMETVEANAVRQALNAKKLPCNNGERHDPITGLCVNNPNALFEEIKKGTAQLDKPCPTGLERSARGGDCHKPCEIGSHWRFDRVTGSFHCRVIGNPSQLSAATLQAQTAAKSNAMSSAKQRIDEDLKRGLLARRKGVAPEEDFD